MAIIFKAIFKAIFKVILKSAFCILYLLFLSGCVGVGSFKNTSLKEVGYAPPQLTLLTKQQNILVIGGTSGVGLEVVKLSLQRGHLVTAVARRPERMTLKHLSLTVLKGDITDLSSMQKLVENHQVVISAIGIPPTTKKVTLFSEGIKNVLIAMDESKVMRLFTVSAIGAGDSLGHGGFFFDNILQPLVLGNDIKDKSAQEVIIKNSEVNWTIVRPGFLIDEAFKNNYRVLINLQGVEAGEISRADVAHFIVASFEQNLYVKQTVLLSR